MTPYSPASIWVISGRIEHVWLAESLFQKKGAFPGSKWPRPTNAGSKGRGAPSHEEMAKKAFLQRWDEAPRGASFVRTWHPAKFRLLGERENHHRLSRLMLKSKWCDNLIQFYQFDQFDTLLLL